MPSLPPQNMCTQSVRHRDLATEEGTERRYGLMQQHAQPVNRPETPLPRSPQQGGFQRHIDNVMHPGRVRQTRQIHIQYAFARHTKAGGIAKQYNVIRHIFQAVEWQIDNSVISHTFGQGIPGRLGPVGQIDPRAPGHQQGVDSGACGPACPDHQRGTSLRIDSGSEVGVEVVVQVPLR